MTAFITSEDVETVLQRPLTDIEARAADYFADLASSEIEEAIGQTFAGATRTVQLAGSWDRYITLPGPATSVSAVTLNGVAIDSTGYTLRGRTLRRGLDIYNEVLDRDDYGLIRQGAQPGDIAYHWSGPNSVVAITYLAPDQTVPAAYRSLCVAAVIRALTNPTFITQETLGLYSVTYANHGVTGTMLSDDERRNLVARYRATVGTITPTR